MSRPDRPFRASWECSNNTTLHRDFATKEARAAWGISANYRLTTVTSRKPLRAGVPVCWVNVYADGYPASHRTKAFADSAASSATLPRLHCIPVYLPGEGAESPAGTSECDTLRAEVQDWASRFKQAQQEVERLKEDLAKTLSEARGADAEVERLTKELAAARAQAMPAGKVVYGARRAQGHGCVEQVEFDSRKKRDEGYQSVLGWKHYTRVEEA